MDDDLEQLSRTQLAEEVRRLRAGIRDHRDSSGHALCWHHPALWNLLPERTSARIEVPEWPQFLRGCIRYRQSLDAQQPRAPRTREESSDADVGAAAAGTAGAGSAGGDRPPRHAESATDAATTASAAAAMRQLLANIDVPALQPAERFYCTALGLHPGRRFGNSGVELLGANVTVFLLVKPAGSAAVPGTELVRDYHRHWTPVHLDLLVEDVDAAVERAVAAGARVEQPATTHAWGRIAMLADPFGHGLCLLRLLGRGYDAMADG